MHLPGSISKAFNGMCLLVFNKLRSWCFFFTLVYGEYNKCLRSLFFGVLRFFYTKDEDEENNMCRKSSCKVWILKRKLHRVRATGDMKMLLYVRSADRVVWGSAGLVWGRDPQYNYMQVGALRRGSGKSDVIKAWKTRKYLIY